MAGPAITGVVTVAATPAVGLLVTSSRRHSRSPPQERSRPTTTRTSRPVERPLLANGLPLLRRILDPESRRSSPGCSPLTASRQRSMSWTSRRRQSFPESPPNQGDRSSRSPEMTAFYGCLYYTALRPEEAVALRFADCDLPGSGWGMLRLAAATPRTAAAWTNCGTSRSAASSDRPQDVVRARP